MNTQTHIKDQSDEQKLANHKHFPYILIFQKAVTNVPQYYNNFDCTP